MHSFKRLFNIVILSLFFIVPAFAQYPGITSNGQLTLAIRLNKIEDVKKALEMKDVNINAKDEEGETPLMAAVRINDAFKSAGDSSDPVEIVKLLIDNGADVNAKDKKGFTPLFIICSQSEYGSLNSEQTVRVAKLLIEKGAAINFNRVDTDMNEGTPLTNACKNAKIDLVKLLIEKGANVNAKGYGDENPLTILLKATAGSMTEATKIKLIQILIAKGARPSQANDRGETASSIAKEHHSKDINDALNGKVIALKEEKIITYEVGGIKHEAGANAQLAAACTSGNLEDLKKAIANGGEVNAVMEGGMMPLEILCHLTTLLVMREKGSVTGTNRDLIAERVKVISYLIEKGAKVNFPDGSHSALYHAVQQGIVISRVGEFTTQDYLPVVKLLLDKGAVPDMEVHIYPGGSPLMIAILSRELELVKFMLPKVKNINTIQGDGLTPLAAARILGGNQEMIQLLIKAGAK